MLYGVVYSIGYSNFFSLIISSLTLIFVSCWQLVESLLCSGLRASLPCSRVRARFPLRFYSIAARLSQPRAFPNHVMGGDSAVEESEGVNVNINVRCSNGSKFSVQTSLDSIVSSFKDLVARNCDMPVEQQRLIYKGRILKDDQTLRSYGISVTYMPVFF